MPSRAATCLRQRPQAAVVHLRHVGKARTEHGIVGADERIVAEQVDMILDQGDRARLDLGAERAGGVGQDQRVAAERLQRARQYVDGSSRHALVQMDAALQTGDLDAAEAAEHQPSGVALDAGARKARQVGIVDRRGVLDRGRDPVEPGAQDQTDPRRAVGKARPNHIDRGRRVVVSAAARPGVLRRCLVILRLGPRPHRLCLAEREGERQQVAEGHRLAQPLRIAQVDRHFRAGELGEALAAAAAGRAQALARGDQQSFRDLALTGCDHRCDRARLGAVAFRVAGVLDVRAGEDAPGCSAHGRTHSKVRVGRMRVIERRACRLQQVLHAAPPPRM